MEAISADGTRLAYNEFGLGREAPLLVFSHGWSCQSEFWRPQIDKFAATHRVVVYDQRGHGGSDRGSRPFSARALGDDLEAILRCVVNPVRKAVVIGHSMGGMSIMAWAAGYPESVNELSRGVLLASTGAAQLVSKSTLLSPSRRETGGFAERVLAKGLGLGGPEVKASLLARALIKYATMGPRASISAVEQCTEVLLQCPPVTRGLWGNVLATIDVRSGIDQLTVPVSVIVGTSDRLTPQVHSTEIADRLRGQDYLSEIVVLPLVGHMSNVEAPQEFNMCVTRLDTATGCCA
ncbi:alpha/beta fold hydrolase [Jongsikchunia kroppenstedtii]|nr:alpha/beta hydrolase [Jongsikchunia kroppenstedtii]